MAALCARRGLWSTNCRRCPMPTMATGKKTQNTLIQQQFDDRAPGYDVDLSYHQPLSDKLIQLARLQPGQRVLDLATGTGLVLMPAARIVGPHGMAVGLDCSRGMLDKARLKFQAAGLTNVQLIQGDMETELHLLPPVQFDAITCSAAVPFLQDPITALTAWKALLAPGGRLVFNTFQSPNMECFDTFISIAHQYGLTAYQDPSAVLGSPELVGDALRSAGFSQYQIEAELKVRPRPDGPAEEQAIAHAERVWKAGTRMNVMFGPIDESVLPDGQLAAFHDQFVQSVVLHLVENGRYARDAFAYHVYHVTAVNE